MGSAAHLVWRRRLPLLLLLLACSFVRLGLAGGCPASCRCLGELLDCSRLKLHRVPEPLPDWIVQLDLSHNRLSSIKPNSLSHLHHLRELKLNSNELEAIPDLGPISANITFLSLEVCNFESRVSTYNIPAELLRRPAYPGVTPPALPVRKKRTRRKRKQKRGCRAGLRVRLGKNPHKPALPSLFVSNVRSLPNKIEELELTISLQKNIRNCCVMIFTETWLDSSIPGEVIELQGRTVHRADRSIVSGKSRGGGVCVYTNDNWSTDVKIMDIHCSPDLEYLAVKCRPFYLPREFNVVIITAIYIPPDANTTTALSCLLTAINKQQQAYPDGVLVVAGDFNQANLKTVLPNFYQYVDCPTRGENTLDQVYSNIKHGYKMKPLPSLGQSDHISLFLIPSYRPLVKRIRPSIREIQVWPVGASEQLQDCFRSTDWALFEEDNVDTYASTVLFYIKSCIDVVTTTRQVRVFSNNKPWLNREVRLLLKARNAAFHSGDELQYREARAKLKRAIRDAKAMYSQRIEQHLESSDTRRVWHGLRQITGQRNKNSLCSSSDFLAEQLNQFFSRFEVETGTTIIPAHTVCKTSLESTIDRQPLVLQISDVRRSFQNINVRKAAGPDGITGRVVRGCAAELAGVFTDIFNLSLLQCSVPTCLKTSVIVPVPKQSAVVSLNDYRPVALTSVIMKCFERLVLDYIKASLPPSLDPWQFAYRRNRSTDDAVSIVLHTVLSHLEQQGTYARLLFVDYSSAFNTILPNRLFFKMINLGLPREICVWIKDFLTDRPQSVRMGSHHSSTLVLSTGAPQGCVLSPFLYSLYTHDCTPLYNTNAIIKFADDTTVVGLIYKNNESAYRKEVQRLILWCKENHLTLNIKKTKELIIDFRRKRIVHLPLYINGEEVERVGSFKFLGTYISEDLSWTINANMLIKKAQKRLYFLRMLSKLNLSQHLLLSYYRSTIESVLTYGILVWFGSSSVADKKALQRTIKIAQNIIGLQLPTLDDIFTSRCLKKSHSILRDSSHPAYNFFELLPSGRRYRTIKTRTTRFLNSFYPRAIIAINNELKDHQ